MRQKETPEHYWWRKRRECRIARVQEYDYGTAYNPDDFKRLTRQQARMIRIIDAKPRMTEEEELDAEIWRNQRRGYGYGAN